MNLLRPTSRVARRIDKHDSGMVVVLVTFCLFILTGCNRDPLSGLYGTWEGKTRIDQNISITMRPDSTIEIETEVDSARQVRKGTYHVIDRRLRIALSSLETYAGDVIKHETKVDQDEALFTMTGKDEMVLRKGTQAIILHRTRGPG
jgi:hypothetical protein